MNAVIVIFFCGFLFNIYKFYKNKRDIKFLNEYLKNSLELYYILLRQQEYNEEVFIFLSRNSTRFNQLVPAKTNFPYTKDIWTVEFMLNNFSNLYNNTHGVERKLVASTKHAIINTVESRIGEIATEQKKVLFKFFPLFFISNFFDFLFTLFTDMFPISTRSNIRKIISFLTDVAGIFGTVAAFSDEFVAIVRKIFIFLF